MTIRANHGYNYEFRCMMEGIDVKFISATVVATPNGTEATININSTKEAFDIKPKTAIQIWYREWFVSDPKWRLLFDGSTSRFDKTDSTSGGAGIAVTCRDFRMDIRKAPCAIVFGGDEAEAQLGTMAAYNSGALYGNSTVPGSTGKGEIRVFDNTGLADLYYIISLVAGTAQNVKAGGIIDSKSATVESANKSIKAEQNTELEMDASLMNNEPSAAQLKAAAKASSEAAKAAETQKQTYGTFKAEAETKSKKEEKKPKVLFGKLFEFDKKGGNEGHWFLDAFIKGLWIEAVGGTYMGQFLNKRIRTDKRFAAMKNEAGFRMFMMQQLQEMTGQYVMGNARFTSIEAMIMRVAGMFMVRPYAISNPPLVDLSDDKVRPYFVSDRVKSGYVDSSIFGAKMMAPFTLLTPPLEFTAPPNCNVFLPAVYDSVSWQHDDDAEITRGYFKIINSFPGNEVSDTFSYSVQVPNTVLNYGGSALAYEKKLDMQVDHAKPDATTVPRPPSISIEERYKGVNILTGSVSDNIARQDLAKHITKYLFNIKYQTAIDAAKSVVETAADKSKGWTPDEVAVADSVISSLKPPLSTMAGVEQAADVKKQLSAIMEKAKASARVRSLISGNNADNMKLSLTHVLERHAVVKFINEKFSGRVAQVGMQLNPYPICGFPGVLVADYREASGDLLGFQTRKSILGTVQQVTHTIHSAGQGQTTVVMNNARYVDEPTYMSRDGLPTYCLPTLKAHVVRNGVSDADYDVDALKYKAFDDDKFFVGDDKTRNGYVRETDINIEFGVDIKSEAQNTEYKYAKDFTTVSAVGLSMGQSNLTYIDQEYAPNLVTRFYKRFLGQDPRKSLMIGLRDKGNYYVFDTIHEAVENLEKDAELMYDYQKAMEWCKRDVIDYTNFYLGICDLAVSDPYANNGDGAIVDGHTSSIRRNVELSRDILPLYSMTQQRWNGFRTSCDMSDNSVLKEAYGSVEAAPNTPEAYWASIIDHSPSTAFLIERRRAIETYKQSIEPYARGVRYDWDAKNG